jgi:hypothetical protein
MRHSVEYGVFASDGIDGLAHQVDVKANPRGYKMSKMETDIIRAFSSILISLI